MGAHAGGGGPQWSTATLSPEQITTLASTSVEIVPAPGVGKILVPLSGWVHYRPGEIPYAGDAVDMGLCYGAFVPAIEGSTATNFWLVSGLHGVGVAANDWLTVTDPMIGYFDTTSGFTYFLVSDVENAPLSFGTASPFDVLDGDGTITVSVLCSTISLDDLGS